MQVYLPDDLYEAVKQHGLPASRLLQEAVRADLRRREAIEEANRYALALIEHAGEPSAEDYAWAEALSQDVRRVEEPSPHVDRATAAPEDRQLGDDALGL